MKNEKKIRVHAYDLPVNDRGKFKPEPKEKRVKVTPVIITALHKRKTTTIKCGKHSFQVTKSI